MGYVSCENGHSLSLISTRVPPLFSQYMASPMHAQQDIPYMKGTVAINTQSRVEQK